MKFRGDSQISITDWTGQECYRTNSNRNEKKLVYLGLSILEISKIIMYEFRYDHVKPKYNEKIKFCYMDTDSFTIYVKTEDSYEDIVKDTGNV